tara:strand:+ start:206 stop:490 length:285 start_codon:yes stop_codon:yes gene_type:complete
MKKLFGSIIGCIARQHEGVTYYRVTCLTAEGNQSFKSAEPVTTGIAMLKHYPVGAELWDGTKAEREFNVCEAVTSSEAIEKAKADLEMCKGLTL